MDVMTTLFPGIVPSLAALTVASMVILASDVIPAAKNRIYFQFTLFATAFGISTFVLITSSESLPAILAAWQAFVSLPYMIRFFLSLAVFAATYFGGGLFVAAPVHIGDGAAVDGKEAFRTPASTDNIVGFDVPTDIPADTKQFFTIMLDKIQREIIADISSHYEMTQEGLEWIDNMITYNVKGGKMNRGISVIDSYTTMVNGNTNSKTRCQAAALGWCIEFLQAFFLVADDIMDDSQTRRGQPCWYKQPNVQMIAINDSFILEACVYKVLKRYFGHESYYYQLVDLFMETTRQTEFGQLLDLTSQPLNGDIDLSRFTMERYTKIVKYKTAFYSFYLPVACGMIMAGVNKVSTFTKAREILLIMGEYFQIQDDYLDCYGAPEVIGKIGTDIQDNKCSWLVVTALNKATDAQRAVLEANYGYKSKKNELAIKKLYQEMDIERDFKEYEEASYKRIQSLMAEVTEIPHQVFLNFLDKIYKRAK